MNTIHNLINPLSAMGNKLCEVQGIVAGALY